MPGSQARLLAKMMATVARQCEADGLPVSEKHAEIMCMPVPHHKAGTLDIKAAGKRYDQTGKLVYPL